MFRQWNLIRNYHIRTPLGEVLGCFHASLSPSAYYDSKDDPFLALFVVYVFHTFGCNVFGKFKLSAIYKKNPEISNSVGEECVLFEPLILVEARNLALPSKPQGVELVRMMQNGKWNMNL